MDWESAIQQIVNSVPTDDETYQGEDGLAYCARCHTPRQSRIELFGQVRIVPCLCRCMAEQRDKDEQEWQAHQRALKLKRIREAGFPEREMQFWTFENDDGKNPRYTNATKAYVEDFEEFRREGKGLFLYGNVGTGKSFFAACVVNALIDRGYRCMMTNFSRLINEISGLWEGKQAYINSLSRLDLIAIDDLGVERDTEYMNEAVTTIIDSLYRSKVPMIITSNYTPRQLTADDNEFRRKRAYDRLLERCLPVEVNGDSRRKQIGRNDYAEFKKRLGL